MYADLINEPITIDLAKEVIQSLLNAESVDERLIRIRAEVKTIIAKQIKTKSTYDKLIENPENKRILDEEYQTLLLDEVFLTIDTTLKKKLSKISHITFQQSVKPVSFSNNWAGLNN
mgnify:FL=1